MSHVPDSPFGCPATWGESIGFIDMGLHVCNRPERHGGRHVCKCGATTEKPKPQ